MIERNITKERALTAEYIIERQKKIMNKQINNILTIYQKEQPVMDIIF